MTHTVVNQLSSLIQARLDCAVSHNHEWRRNHEASIREIEQSYLPHGSGFDAGCKVDLTAEYVSK